MADTPLCPISLVTAEPCLLSRSPTSSQPATLLARLLVMRMLFQLAQEPTLLQLHVEAL